MLVEESALIVPYGASSLFPNAREGEAICVFPFFLSVLSGFHGVLGGTLLGTVIDVVALLPPVHNIATAAPAIIGATPLVDPLCQELVRFFLYSSLLVYAYQYWLMV